MAPSVEWRQEGEALVRDLRFEDFPAAIAFVNRMADAAEAANHHPDILVHGRNRVRLTLTTHSEGRLTHDDREHGRDDRRPRVRPVTRC